MTFDANYVLPLPQPPPPPPPPAPSVSEWQPLPFWFTRITGPALPPNSYERHCKANGLFPNDCPCVFWYNSDCFQMRHLTNEIKHNGIRNLIRRHFGLKIKRRFLREIENTKRKILSYIENNHKTDVVTHLMETYKINEDQAYVVLSHLDKEKLIEHDHTDSGGIRKCVVSLKGYVYLCLHV